MKLLVVVICAAIAGVHSSQDVMKEMTLKFGKPLEECKKEHNLPDSVEKDFMNFWKEDHVLTDRMTGCAIMCLAGKLNIHDETGKLHHEKAMEFAKSHGADDTMAKTLLDLVVGCEESVPDNPDSCLKVLEIAKCFKDGVHKLNWAPSMDLMIGEVLAEV